MLVVEREMQQELNHTKSTICSATPSHSLRRRWHVEVCKGGIAPGMLYTVGLWQEYGHPELLMFSSSENPGCLVHCLNALAERVADGEFMVINQRQTGVFAKRMAVFRTIHWSWLTAVLPRAANFYGDKPFKAVQVFWSDDRGFFPWEADFDPLFKSYQPILEAPCNHYLAMWDKSAENQMLSSWRWLISYDKNLFHVTRMGDLVLIDRRGVIWLLDTGNAKLTIIAGSPQCWQRKAGLLSAQLLRGPLVRVLEREGKACPRDCVYGWRKMPFLGGEEKMCNVVAQHTVSYLKLTGHLAEAHFKNKKPSKKFPA